MPEDTTINRPLTGDLPQPFLDETEIKHLARQNFLAGTAESSLSELDSPFHPVFVHRAVRRLAG